MRQEMHEAKVFFRNSSFQKDAAIDHRPLHQRNPKQDSYLEVLTQSCLHYDPHGKSFFASDKRIAWSKAYILFPEPFLCSQSVLQTKGGRWYEASSAPNIVLINFCPSCALVQKRNTWACFPTLIIPIKAPLWSASQITVHCIFYNK